MKLPTHRNDRILLGTAAALIGLGLATGLSNMTIRPPASADILISEAHANVPPRAQPARGVVPHAHNIDKIVKTDDPISIVRSPADLPKPIGRRGPQRVKVDLETVEVTGSSRTERPTATGPSTRRFRGPSSAFASATPSRCG